MSCSKNLKMWNRCRIGFGILTILALALTMIFYNIGDTSTSLALPETISSVVTLVFGISGLSAYWKHADLRDTSDEHSKLSWYHKAGATVGYLLLMLSPFFLLFSTMCTTSPTWAILAYSSGGLGTFLVILTMFAKNTMCHSWSDPFAPNSDAQEAVWQTIVPTEYDANLEEIQGDAKNPDHTPESDAQEAVWQQNLQTEYDANLKEIHADAENPDYTAEYEKFMIDILNEKSKALGLDIAEKDTPTNPAPRPTSGNVSSGTVEKVKKNGNTQPNVSTQSGHTPIDDMDPNAGFWGISQDILGFCDNMKKLKDKYGNETDYTNKQFKAEVEKLLNQDRVIPKNINNKRRRLAARLQKMLAK